MKQNSVNSNNVNWTLLEDSASHSGENLSSPYQLGKVMRYLYKSVDDFHGAFFYRDIVFKYNRHEPIISDSIKNEWEKRSGIKALLLEDKIGYLRVPSMQGESKNTFDALAQNLNDSLCLLVSNNVRGIIFH